MYQVYFDGMILPVTPSAIDIKIGNRNQKVDLINGGEINVLKSPSLTTISFKAIFPAQKYPFVTTLYSLSTYMEALKHLKEDKKVFQFIVIRATPGGERLWDTNIKVSLENYTISEDADNGNDIVCNIELKQYRSYGVKLATVEDAALFITKTRETSSATTSGTYTVKSGDTLWAIAKKYYGDATKWPKIYEANKTAIEAEAKKYGKASSSNGHWIYPSLKLTIPDINATETTGTTVTTQAAETTVNPRVIKLTINQSNSFKDAIGSLEIAGRFAVKTTNGGYVPSTVLSVKTYSGTESPLTIMLTAGQSVQITINPKKGYGFQFTPRETEDWRRADKNNKIIYECLPATDKTVNIRWVR